MITGSTGFLGKHLIEHLRRTEPRAQLRVMARGQGPTTSGGAFETVRGDITKPEQVMAAVKGVDQIFHLAGVVERKSPHPWRLYDVHVEGTRNVCEAMREHGVEKAVFASTSGVLAVGTEPVERDESFPYAQDIVWDWPYYVSKIYAEKLALWYVEHHELPIVCINPSLLLGPGDERRSSTKDVELFLRGQIMVTPVGGLSVVDVRDVAVGAAAAMEWGRVGERYLLAGANMSFHEWIERTARIAEVRSPKMMVPLSMQLLGARIMRRLYPLVRRRFELDDESIKMSSLYWYCNTKKAQEELGFTARNPDETLRATVEYLRSQMA